MTRKILVEGIGTFFLMLTVGMVVLAPGAGAFGPLGYGAVLAAMVYAGGHVSGAHYNPAITLAVFIRGKATIHDVIGYIVFQLVAAAIAATLVLWFKEGGPLTLPEWDIPRVIAAEFIFTFALVFVVLNVATARGVEGNSYYGIAIALIVVAGAYAVGPLSGSALNPAVTIGSYVLGGLGGLDVAFFIAAQLLAGVSAALMFRVLDLGEDKPTTATEDEQEGLIPQAQPQ
jgi:aquaporin Z